MSQTRQFTAGRPGGPRARLLIVPGLHDSGPAHWQTWLQSLHRHAVRVEQADWAQPDLDPWAQRIVDTVAQAGPGPWLVAAHSFGCLAFARSLARLPAHSVVSALLVAPADPVKFGVSEVLPSQALGIASMLVASETDPWMRVDQAALWAQRWGSSWVNLGDAGHINTESGFGPLPLAQRWVSQSLQRVERERRVHRASFSEWSFAL